MVSSIQLKVRPDLVNTKFANKVMDLIVETGLELYLDGESRPDGLRLNHKLVELKKTEADCIMILGGDGTILHTIHNLPLKCPPILGVDMGTTGFLTEITPKEVETAVEKLSKDRFKVVNRMRLKAHIDRGDIPDSVNEILITTEPGKTIKLDVFINDKFVNRLVGDGLIAATPTGSTAYSLSAGGSIIDNELEAYTIVPICAFKSSLNPIVLPHFKKVKLKLVDKDKKHLLVVDGQLRFNINYGQDILIGKSSNPVPFIRFYDNYYKRIREKLLTSYKVDGFD